MNYWKKVINKDSAQYNENLKGKLLVATDKGVMPHSFHYAIVTARKYTSMVSTMPLEYIAPSETIYTSEIDIGFTKGASIQLDDGAVMTIRDMETVYNVDSGKIKAYVIMLEGGGPSEYC